MCVAVLVNRLPDTNTILRYLIGDSVELHEQSKVFYEEVRLGRQRAIILESVVVECVYVMTKFYNIPKERVSKSLISLLHYKGIINSDREELIEALTIFTNRNIDIVDCVLLAKSKSLNIPIFTFDKKLRS